MYITGTFIKHYQAIWVRTGTVDECTDTVINSQWLSTSNSYWNDIKCDSRIWKAIMLSYFDSLHVDTSWRSSCCLALLSSDCCLYATLPWMKISSKWTHSLLWNFYASFTLCHHESCSGYIYLRIYVSLTTNRDILM